MHAKPKKSLGQNFLIDRNIRRKIILSCRLNKQDTVLEIGSGRGELTGLIACEAKKVYAVETDWRLCPDLEDSLKGLRNVKIIRSDILKLNLNARRFASCNLKVIGNIPYYITTPIIEHLFKYKDKIGDIFITVQKEFAQRAVSPPGSGNYGSLSCFLRYYSEPQILFPIKKNCFSPSPKVDSCFLHLKIRRKPALKLKDEEFFFCIIRSAFNQRRKTLRNSLKEVVSRQSLESFFKNYDVDPDIRPEDLSIEDFANLASSVVSA